MRNRLMSKGRGINVRREDVEIKYNLMIIYLFILIVAVVWQMGLVTAVTAVSSCPTTLSNAGEVYNITANLTSVGTCLTVTANNVVIEGNGFSITGNGVGVGVNATNGTGPGWNNITLQNLNLNNFTIGIATNGVTYNTLGYRAGNVTVINSTLGNIDSYGSPAPAMGGLSGGRGGFIVIRGSQTGNINTYGGYGSEGFAVSGGAGGFVTIEDSNVANVSNYGGLGAPNAGTGGVVLLVRSNASYVYSYGGASSTDHGGNAGSVGVVNSTLTAIYSYGGSGSINGPGSGASVSINDSILNSIYNYGGLGAVSYGGNAGSSLISNSSLSVIQSYGGSTTGGNGLGGNGGNVQIINNFVNLSNSIINITYGLESGNDFNNGTSGILTLNYTSGLEDVNTNYGMNIFLRIINSSAGEIRWLGNILSSSLGNIAGNVTISNNFVEVNSGSLSLLNVTANVTLYNSPGYGYNNWSIRRNGADCVVGTNPSCWNFTSLSASTVVFNVSSWTNYTIFGGDGLAPIVTINNPTNKTYNAADLSVALELLFNVTLNENGSVRFSLDNAAVNLTMSSTDNQHFNYTNASIGNGQYTMKVYANDTAGNENNTESVVFVIDQTNPQVTINLPTSGATYTTATTTVNITLNEAGYCEYSLNNGATNITLTNNSALTEFTGTTASLSNAAYTLKAYCNDSVGNGNYTTNVSFTISVSSGGGTEPPGGGGGGCTVTTLTCGEWSLCVDGNQTRSCQTNCGTRTERRDCVEECIPAWTSWTDWSTCSNGKSIRERIDINGCEEKEIQEDLCTKEGCVPDVECGEWGRCAYTQKIEDIFAGKIRKSGIQEKQCIDSNGCIDNYVDELSCNSEIRVKLVIENICGKETLKAINADSGAPITNIDVENWREKGKLNVLFVQADAKTCSTCFNGVKDEDEAGTDCGGNCKACVTTQGISLNFLRWPLWILFVLLIAFLLVRVTKEDRITKINKLIKYGEKLLKEEKAREAVAVYQRIKKIYQKANREQKKEIRKEIVNFYLALKDNTDKKK